MTAFVSDLRLAARALGKSRGFTVTAVVTLGLGMTLFTTALAVVNAYLLNGLPYPAADRLYWLRYAAPGQDEPRNMEALDWRSLDDVIEHPIAWDLDMFYLLGGDHAESAPGAWVTPGFVQGLGIQPAIGRGFEADAFVTGAENVALISHRLWATRFAGDPSIVGRTFSAYVSDRPQEAESFRIIGVLPERFWHINPYTDILVPLRAPTYPYMARLRPGVTAATVGDRVRALVAAGASRVPDRWSPQIVAVRETYVAQTRPVLRTATVAAALVLLVGCANVAGLLLVRAARRTREMAIRVALGAGRTAIARVLLAEGVLLGAAATLLSLVATYFVLDSVAVLIQQQLGRPAPGGTAALALDARVVALAAGVGLATAILCTLVPLLTTLRGRVSERLQHVTRSTTDGPASQRIRSALIALEIAASVALLAGSALMVRSVVNLLNVNLGFSSERVLTASVTLRQHRYPDATSRAAVFERMVSRVSAVSGMESVGLMTSYPVQQPRTVPVAAADLNAGGAVRAGVHGVSPSYFEALQIPLVAGRVFTSSDRVGSEPIAVVSEFLARALWPAGDALGRRVVVPEPREGSPAPVPVHRLVVGIVRDVRQGTSDVELADLYLPMLQSPTRFAFVVARTAGPPSTLLPAVKSALRDVDPQFALDRARPLQAIVDEITARPRFMAALLAWLASAAAILALVGVYGVIAYAVRQREREIAVRLAIGADPARITRLFMRQGGGVVLGGLVLGAAAALLSGRLVEAQLFGVTRRDPVALAAALAMFGVAALAAIWWPARRAASTDPAVALRVE